MSLVFMDTSAWVALTFARDQHHEDAAACFRELTKSRTYLVTTDYVLDETLTLMKHWAVPANRIAAFYKQLHLAEVKGTVKLVFMDPRVFDEAWEQFQTYADQTLSFTDCATFAVARSLNVDAVFTFDRRFKLAGFRLIP